MFNSEHVLYLNFPWTFFKSMFYTKTNYIGITNIYFLDLTSWVLIPTTIFVDLTIAVDTTGPFFFLLWQVSIK